jgi:hypothetical protein
MKMLPQGSIFISYRRSDSIDVTGRIYDQLASHYGQGVVFKDVDSIPYGTDFREHIRYWVNRCQVLIAVIGPTWLKAKDSSGNPKLNNSQDWVRVELETALERKIVIIPVLVNNACSIKATELPDSLQNIAYLNYAQARPDPDFHQDLKRLIKNLDTALSPQREPLSVNPAFPEPELKRLGSKNSRLSVLKANELEKRLSVCFEDYEALSQQLSYISNAVEKNNLKRQQRLLEKEISDLEIELQNLNEL